MKKQPRPHQSEQIQAAVSYFASQSRGKLISACGTGKTLTALWVAEQLCCKNIVIGVPSLALQDQYCVSFLSELEGLEYEIIAIGSDYSLEKSHNIQVTTDYQAICNFLSQKSDKKKIIFTTYQSTPQLFSAAQLIGFKADFCIIDEAHRTAGMEFSLFSGILSDENLSCAKRLFMTATPRFFKDDELLSMDNAAIYGTEIHRLDTDEAIKRGILCDYKVIVLYCTDEAIKRGFVVSSNRKSGDLVAPGKYFSMASAMQIAIEKYGLKRIVTFHKNIKLAKLMQAIVNDILPPEYEGFHVNYTNTINSRREILSRMKIAKIGVVTNAKALGEGWDMPECDGIVFVDAKKSAFEIIQAVGRALRRHETKEKGYVIVPVMISESGFVNPEDFDNLRIALTSIGMMDKRMNEYIKNDTHSNFSNPMIDIVKDRRLPPAINIEELMGKISLRVWDRLKITQWKPFAELREWAIESLKPKGINTGIRYREYLRQNPSLTTNIPITPELVYSEWQGWEHFFDKKEKWDLFTYEEAKAVLSAFPAINTLPKYLKWRDGKFKSMPPFPDKLPASPSKTYAAQWKGYPDYFGYEPDATQQMSYADAEKWVSENLLPIGINTRTKFYNWSKNKSFPLRPKGFPTNPDKIYLNDWKGWEIFFGRKKTKNVERWDYSEAQKWVAENLIPLGINSFIKWGDYLRGEYQNAPERPSEIPTNLSTLKGWGGYDKFFGKEKYYKNWYSFTEAREEAMKVAKLGINTATKWGMWQKGEILTSVPYPERMPKSNIPNFYRNVWQGWQYFFGI